MPAAGTVTTNLNVVPQGDTESMRNGRKIVIKSIWIKGYIELIPAGGLQVAAADVYRMVLIQDKQANGATFAVTDYLVSASAIAHKNLANSSRFVTLWESHRALVAGSGVSGAFGDSIHAVNKYIKCSIPIEFDASATTGAITTQRSNSLALLLLSSDGLCATNFTVRIRYQDN